LLAATTTDFRDRPLFPSGGAAAAPAARGTSRILVTLQPTGRSFALEVEPANTLASVKQRLCSDALQLGSDGLRAPLTLVLASGKLLHDRTLADYGIHDGATLQAPLLLHWRSDGPVAPGMRL
jgi:hypothetical protein